MSTYQFIKNGQADDALKIAKILLLDTHDLIHKVVGWMLREVGKRVSLDVERNFLNTYAQQMPRTMLRYAIERMPMPEREKILSARQKMIHDRFSKINHSLSHLYIYI